MAKKKKRLDRSDFISITALLMSMIAVFVSIYEARILKEQQLIMLAQEKTSVWPYLDEVLSFEYAEKVRIRIIFENKGIGPAKIRKMDLMINGTEIADYVSLVDSLARYFPAEVDLGVSYQPAEGDVISPGEKITALMIESNRFPEDLQQIRNINLRFDVCYCSVYDDCWHIDLQDKQQQEPCDF